MQVLQLKGFSHAAKDRWVVVAPRFSPPSEGSGGVGIVRIMMLAYRCGAALAGLCTELGFDSAGLHMETGEKHASNSAGCCQAVNSIAWYIRAVAGVRGCCICLLSMC
jgi:hypothetical protein